MKIRAGVCRIYIAPMPSAPLSKRVDNVMPAVSTQMASFIASERVGMARPVGVCEDSRPWWIGGGDGEFMRGEKAAATGAFHVFADFSEALEAGLPYQ